MFKCAMIVLSSILVAVCSASTAGAQAGEFHNQVRGHGYHSQPSFSGENGLPSYISRLGTYSGGIAAARSKRNGTYFSVDGGSAHLPASGRIDAVEPRIIPVNEQNFDADCAYEAGVCVIRP